eukprot:TRINITY_DN30475_c0_g1_i1.p1 TRINITY_DN30475_c0_g1~~TRINITY_DN30475_c0_g1_i1.p1  ORF type:complete len:375 (-),score=104.30 TRINITY_DN30475_c0_g1_i1:110-1234(-)
MSRMAPALAHPETSSSCGRFEGISSQQVEWDQRMSMLDRQQKEIHQTQLKIVRGQTIAFVRDLTKVRHEVVELKVAVDLIKSSLDREKQERVNTMCQLDNLYAQLVEVGLPRLATTLEAKMQDIERQLREELLREVCARRAEAGDLTTGLAVAMQDIAQEAFKAPLGTLEGKMSDFEHNLQAMQKDFGEKAALGSQKLEGLTRNLESAQSLLGEQQGAWAKLEKHVEDMEQGFKQQLELSRAHLKGFQSALAERLEQLHGRHASLEGLHNDVAHAFKEHKAWHGKLEHSYLELSQRQAQVQSRHACLEKNHIALESLHRELAGSLKECQGCLNGDLGSSGSSFSKSEAGLARRSTCFQRIGVLCSPCQGRTCEQ